MNSNDSWITSVRLNDAFLRTLNKAYYIIPGAENPYFREPDCTYYPRYMIEVIAAIRYDLEEVMEARKEKRRLEAIIHYVQGN